MAGLYRSLAQREGSESVMVADIPTRMRSYNVETVTTEGLYLRLELSQSYLLLEHKEANQKRGLKAHNLKFLGSNSFKLLSRFHQRPLLTP